MIINMNEILTILGYSAYFFIALEFFRYLYNILILKKKLTKMKELEAFRKKINDVIEGRNPNLIFYIYKKLDILYDKLFGDAETLYHRMDSIAQFGFLGTLAGIMLSIRRLVPVNDTDSMSDLFEVFVQKAPADMGIALYTTLTAIVATIVLRKFLSLALKKSYSKYYEFQDNILNIALKNSNLQYEDSSTSISILSEETLNSINQKNIELLNEIEEKYRDIVNENKEITLKMMEILKENQEIVKTVLNERNIKND